jgi:hypothetical protein
MAYLPHKNSIANSDNYLFILGENIAQNTGENWS